MFGEAPELPALIVFLILGIVPAALVYFSREDFFDPRVSFVLAYVYLTAGPVIYSLLMNDPYHPGMKVDNLSAVLISCGTAIVGFSIGASIALKGHRVNRNVGSATLTPYARETNSTLRGICLLGCLLAMALMAHFGSRIQTNQFMTNITKSHYVLYADEGDLRLKTIFSGLSSFFIILFLITDKFCASKRLSLTSIFVMLVYVGICFSNGEREAVLVVLVWIAIHWQELTKTQILSFGGFCVLMVGMSPLLRKFGLGVESQLSMVGQVKGEDFLKSIVHLSSNLHVYTNVVSIVPDIEPFWQGKSILSTLASFIPGRFELKELTPARWFREVYDMQRISRFAFSQDAEAYLNFGWVGPPIWFSVWGCFLGTMYRKATSPKTNSIDSFLWWNALSVSLFSIRSDSRGFIKLLVVALVLSKLLWIFSDMMTKRRSQVVSVQKTSRTPVPHKTAA